MFLTLLVLWLIAGVINACLMAKHSLLCDDWLTYGEVAESIFVIFVLFAVGIIGLITSIVIWFSEREFWKNKPFWIK